MNIGLQKLSKSENAQGVVRALVITWTTLASIMAIPVYNTVTAGIAILSDMHGNINSINLKIASYDELRKQRETMLTNLNTKDQAHDARIMDHEHRLSQIEGQLTRLNIARDFTSKVK